NTRAGIHAPASAALFVLVASAMPSSDPFPYSSGRLDNRFESPIEIQAAISAPAPGNIPTTAPRLLERRKAVILLLRRVKEFRKVAPIPTAAFATGSFSIPSRKLARFLRT